MPKSNTTQPLDGGAAAQEQAQPQTPVMSRRRPSDSDGPIYSRHDSENDVERGNGHDHPPDEAQEFRSAKRAIFELLDMQDKRLNAHDVHATTVAQQVAELAISMDTLRREIPAAMAAGLKLAVSDPTLWAAAGEAMHAQARSAAGGWLFGGIKSMGTRLAWIAALSFCLYAVGGPTAVIAFFKSQHP
jgi:hypothetical protein